MINEALWPSTDKEWFAVAAPILSALRLGPRKAAQLPQSPVDTANILSWLEYRGHAQWDRETGTWAANSYLNLEALVQHVADSFGLSPVDLVHGGKIGLHVVARDQVVGYALTYGWDLKDIARTFGRTVQWASAAAGRYRLRESRAA